MPLTRFLPPSAERSSPWRLRLLAALFHLGLSVVVAGFTALLVFWLWYPAPFRELSGGRDLFLLVIAVDVVIGPLLTAVVFDTRKPRAELMRDLGVIAALQMGALAYGTHTVTLARPAVVALEGNRLRVVRAIDLANADWAKAPHGLEVKLFSGPIAVATRSASASEKNDTLFRGLAGEDVGMRPAFWLPASETSAAFIHAAKPLGGLTRLHPDRLAQLKQMVASTGLEPTRLGYLPVLARSTNWSALIDLKDGSIAAYVSIDGF
jgi:hypothetical protein